MWSPTLKNNERESYFDELFELKNFFSNFASSYPTGTVIFHPESDG